LEKMERLVPLEFFCGCVEPYYYVKGKGREPTALSVMVKMYLISSWYNLSDEGAEDLIYENQAVRRYVGIDLSEENAPDRTTLCKFRKILEKNGINKKIFEEMNRRYKESGIIFKEGAIVDATIIEAPDSLKNKDKRRDEEMSATRKNNRYYFGFKANIAADKDSGLVTALTVTTAKTADIEAASNVLTGEEKEVYGDAGYIGITHREDICVKFKDEEKRGTVIYYNHKKGRLRLDKIRDDVKFEINRKRYEIRKMAIGMERDKVKEEERAKSKVRAKVEHPFRIVKNVFGFRKARYRGLEKNLNKLYMLFCLANIYLVMQKKEKAANK